LKAALKATCANKKAGEALMFDDDRDALAAEYVLGTLSADEREQAESLLTLDSGFAEIVRVWEHRLGELNVMVEAVEPPADIWDKVRTEIESARGEGTEATYAAAASEAIIAEDEPQPGATPLLSETVPDEAPEPGFDLVPDLLSERTPDLDSADQPKALDSSEHTTHELDETSLVDALASTLLPQTSPTPPTPKFDGRLPPSPPAVAPPEGDADTDVVALRSGLRRWRSLALALGAAAAVLAAYVGLAKFAPGLTQAGRQSQPALAAPKGPASSRLVAVLQQEPTAPAFLLTLNAEGRTMTVRRLTAAADAGRTYELWLFSSKLQKPASLGAVGADEFTTRPIPANVDVETMRSATYGISLEPAGGSQSGAPNGPMLFRGRMVEALPGSPG
jgi:anti-sigma-K factor RskA